MILNFRMDFFDSVSMCAASREMGLGKKIPNLARGWLRWWWSGQDFHSNVINFGSGLEHSFAFLILNVPIWPKPGKWFPHEILPLIGEMVREICTTMPCPKYSSEKLFWIWSFQPVSYLIIDCGPFYSTEILKSDYSPPEKTLFCKTSVISETICQPSRYGRGRSVKTAPF